MKYPRRPLVVLAAAALAVGMAGCSSDEAPEEKGDICTQLEDISTFEMESQSSAAIDPADWAGMQAVLEKYGDGLSEHYDPAIASADENISADLTTVRDASAQVTSLVTESATFEEYQQKTEATIDAATFTAASEASTRIDDFAKANCDFAKQQQQEQQPVQPPLEEAPQPEG
ncbi:MAG: hypothetical protein WBQ44_07865 [Rhodococcus sp. (in: high G+C Gram-positive bacteria)]